MLALLSGDPFIEGCPQALHSSHYRPQALCWCKHQVDRMDLAVERRSGLREDDHYRRRIFSLQRITLHISAVRRLGLSFHRNLLEVRGPRAWARSKTGKAGAVYFLVIESVNHKYRTQREKVHTLCVHSSTLI